MNNICKLFLEAASKYPKKTAIIDGDKQIDFRTLEKQVRETAGYFKKKGIKKHDRILIFIPMGIDLYRTVLALFYIGAGAVFLDEWVSKKRMELCCKIADCSAFAGIFKARIFALFSSELRKIPIKFGKKYTIGEIPELVEVDKDTTALITFTTGSSGTPKAADRSHNFLNEQFNALLQEIDPKPEDVDMTVLPIVLFVNLGVGCTSVIADFKASKPDTLQAEKIISQIKKHKINRITASPFFIKKVSQKIIETSNKLDTVQKIFTGGAPVFPHEAEIYKAAFPDSEINIVYGSTEAEPISSIKIDDLLAQTDNLSKIGLPVGEIFEKTSLKIIEYTDKNIEISSLQELEKLEVEQGRVGEIIVSGNHVLDRYFNNEKAFKRNKIIFKNSLWHRTGDSGRLAENGKLYLTGQCKQLIFKDKDIISPFIVENMLGEIHGIEIATILSENDKIIIVAELKKDYKKIPLENLQSIIYDKIIYLDKIPRDPRHNSKIDYESLRKMCNFVSL